MKEEIEKQLLLEYKDYINVSFKAAYNKLPLH
jgi:hypothetical protein